jgi:hypothetical protein
MLFMSATWTQAEMEKSPDGAAICMVAYCAVDVKWAAFPATAGVACVGFPEAVASFSFPE